MAEKKKLKRRHIIELRTLRKKLSELEKQIAKRKQLEQQIKQKNEDLNLINALNNAVNRGDDLSKILNILTKKTIRTYSCHGATIYLLSEDKKYLVLQRTRHFDTRTKKITKLIGFTIPQEIKLKLDKGNVYWKIIKKKKPQLINAPDTIKKLIFQFSDVKLSKRYVTKIYKKLKIRSVVAIPLITEGNTIGLMDISRDKPFDQSELLRLKEIAEQITTILKHWKAKQVLIESEEKYRHVAEDSIDGIGIAQGGRFIYANNALCKIFGYKKSELIGESILKIVAPEDRMLITKRSKARSIGKKVPDNYVFKGFTKDGTILDIEFSSSDAFYYKGKTTILAILRDITARVKAEEAVKKSEIRFRKFMDSATDGFILFDSLLNIIDVNNYILDKFGVKKKDVIGSNIVDIWLDTWESGRYYEYQKVIKTGKPYVIDEIITPHEYGNKCVMIKAFKVGKGLGMILRDITEQKSAERRLLLTNEILQHLLAATSAIVYAARPSGDYGATFMSDNVTDLFGYAPSQFLEESGFWLDHVHPDDTQHVLSEVQKIFKKKQYTYTYRFRCKDGQYIWVRDSMKLILDEKGKPIEIIGYLTDITDHKKKNR